MTDDDLSPAQRTAYAIYGAVHPDKEWPTEERERAHWIDVGQKFLDLLTAYEIAKEKQTPLWLKSLRVVRNVFAYAMLIQVVEMMFGLVEVRWIG